MLLDAYFAGRWTQSDADNAENGMLHTGHLIMYAVCTVLWHSKLKTEIYLSTTEVEYIALIQAMRNVITFMMLTKKISFIIDIDLPNQGVFC